MNTRESMALAFAQTLLAMPQSELDLLEYAPDGPLVMSGAEDGFSICKTAIKMADDLIVALENT